MLITDQQLIDTLPKLARSERQDQNVLLVHLSEMAERKLYLGLGYGSMWSYCRKALKFSESVSQQRIVVAKAARKYPVILAMLGWAVDAVYGGGSRAGVER